MKSSQMRVFTEDGIPYSFNSKAFRDILDRICREQGIRKSQLIERLVKEFHVTADAINNWQYGKNGPGGIDAIKEVARVLHVAWTDLVRRMEGGANVQQLTERQKDAAKRIYDVLIWYLEEFSNTDGFHSWSPDLKDGGGNSEDERYERITRMKERVSLVLNQEYFDLHDHEIYDAFCEFAGEDLTLMYEGGSGADGPTVWRDYEKAMQRLNEIVERYI